MSTPMLTMPHWPKLLIEDRPGTPLERTQKLLAKLGNPEKKLPPVVHVAGTNGKGSTIAFLRAIFEAAGYKVHVYTSPHLHRFNERITLASREIDDTTLFTAIEQTRIASGDDNVSFFEGTTAAALLAFSQTPADIVLMETGAGGRFDPTNVIENPALTIITTISEDHTDILGKTLTDIAWHKAGIMREDTPCIIGFQPEEALRVLQRENAPMYVYGKDWAVQKTEGGFDFITSDGKTDFPQPNLSGPHQLLNAGNAIAALSGLSDFDISYEAIAEGIQNAKWPGRLERMHKKSLPEGFELWIDGGHNMAAGHMLAAHIEQSWQDKPTHIIFGTTQGKDVASMLMPLIAKAESITAIPVISEPKSYAASDIVRLMQPHIEVIPHENLEAAITHITETKPPSRILIFGSLYLHILAKNLAPS